MTGRNQGFESAADRQTDKGNCRADEHGAKEDVAEDRVGSSVGDPDEEDLSSQAHQPNTQGHRPAADDIKPALLEIERVDPVVGQGACESEGENRPQSNVRACEYPLVSSLAAYDGEGEVGDAQQDSHKADLTKRCCAQAASSKNVACEV